MRCRWELKWHKFGLTHHRPASFGTTQWQVVEKLGTPFSLYFTYRIVVFAYFWGFFIHNLLNDYPGGELSYYMIYLTNWTYLSAIADIAVQLISALFAIYRCHKGIKPMVPGWLYKTHWVIINISHTIAPLVTAMYWAGVYPALGVPVTYADIHLHALTTLYTLVDLFIHGAPRRFHHVIYPLCFGIAYLLFSIIYYFCGGLDPSGKTGIYPILDWADPGLSAGTSVIACLVVVIMHGMTWGIVRLRLKLHGRWLGRKVAVEAGFDANGGGSGASGDVGVVEAGGAPKGEEDVYVNVDIGDGGQVGKVTADDLPQRRPVGVEKAFDNAAIVMDEDGLHASGRDAPVA